MPLNDTKNPRPSLKPKFLNPFRPGAGHVPPFLAGRQRQQAEFSDLLQQDTILKNLILTGLRGVGKTVLLDTFRPIAIQQHWGWVGTDLSESASITEEHMAIRILTDLSVFTSGLTIPADSRAVGFERRKTVQKPLSHQALMSIFHASPGLFTDKLKRVLESVWQAMLVDNRRGIVFAYDEAQNLADHKDKAQFPLSMLLDVFQSLQRRDMRFMLVLTGLPTLFSKLVEARTYSERMFHIVFLSHLSREASRDAIVVPTSKRDCPVQPNRKTVEMIIDNTGGYPYFLQFVCKEAYDIWLQNNRRIVPMDDVMAKLDADFFAGRWAKATDRQRDLLNAIADLPNCDSEFTGQEIVNALKGTSRKQFSSSHVNQMLSSLQDAGLVYRNRHGKYSFAVPLLGQFIHRQTEQQVEA